MYGGHFFLLLLFFQQISAFPNGTISSSSSFPPGPWQIFQKLKGCHKGDTLTGISNLKNYLHTFGYIPSPSTNFTDHYDTSIESAIKTYQHNFNLNVTGQLDSSTLTHLMLPRCGVPDLLNGTNTMKASSPQTPPTGIHNFMHYTFFPGSPRWDKTQLTFAFSMERRLSESEKGVFRRAFTRWGNVTTLVFTEGESYENADIRIAFFGGEHGDGEAFDGRLGTLAHAFSPPSGRLHLDVDEEWVVEEGGSSGVDMETVAVHEIGHVLGLGHSSVEGSVMYPVISSREKKVELHGDDVEGIQALYGARLDSGGSAATASSADDEREQSGGVGGGGGLGLVGVLGCAFVCFSFWFGLGL